MSEYIKVYDSSHHDTCVKGMACVLWGSAWADHVEGHRCRRLSGMKIEEVMPPIPPEAYAMAERILGHIEQANGMSWPRLLAQAWKADCKAEKFEEDADYIFKDADYRSLSYHGEYASRFGECLAYAAMGAGVSWEDDHAHFPLEVPLCGEDSSFELQHLAGNRCEEPGRAFCTSCSGYLDEEGCCSANGCEAVERSQ